jgi:transcription antitermination factor NusG
MRELHTDIDPRNGTEWSAVYTRHQHEKSVANNFSRNGFEAFLPLYQVERQWKHRRKQLSLPLFPCYVFVRFQFGRHLHIISTPGVHFIVMDASRPAHISNAEIEAIRRAITHGHMVEPHLFLRCGELVRIKTGPLAGIEGILIRKKSSCRLVLSAQVLRQSIAVEVDAFNVEPLPNRLLTSSSPDRSQRFVSSNIENESTFTTTTL